MYTEKFTLYSLTTTITKTKTTTLSYTNRRRKQHYTTVHYYCNTLFEFMPLGNPSHMGKKETMKYQRIKLLFFNGKTQAKVAVFNRLISMGNYSYICFFIFYFLFCFFFLFSFFIRTREEFCVCACVCVSV